MDSYNKVTELLNNFFKLKFTLKGEELIKAIESFSWQSIQNSDDIISVVKSHHDSEFSKKENITTVSITFPLDKNGKPHLSFDLLKASCCFPWELDPLKKPVLWLKLCTLHHVLLQLAQSSYYGLPKAASLLRDVATQYMNLKEDHPFQLDKMQKAHGYLVYRFPIHFDKDFKHPEEDLKTGKHNLSEMGEGTFTKLFQYFYEVESSGLLKPQEPLPKKSFPLESKLAYLKMPKTHFHILVSGQNSKDPFLWDLISRNLKIEAKTSDEVKGSCVICQTDFNLHFSRVDKIPKGSDLEVDGIIFADFQENPEEKVDEMKSRFKVKTFIFYETPAPNPRRASYIYYLSKEDIEENKTANEVFLIFVRHLMSDY